MFKFSVRHVISLVLICGSLILGVWVYFPLDEHEQITPIPGFGQQRLTWTPVARFGNVTDITLEFSSDDDQQVINSLFNEQNKELNLNEEIILEKTHNLIIEARIEIPGAKIQPNEQISQPFSQRDNLNFRWQIVPVVREIISGEVWLYIHLIPLGSGSDIRRPILIQGITIQTIHLFGMTARTAKLLLVTGMGIGFILWFDLVGKIIPVLKNRKQKR